MCSLGSTLRVGPGFSAGAMATGGRGNVSLTRRLSMDSYMVRIYTGSLNLEHEFTSVEAEKITTAQEVVRTAAKKLRLDRPEDYELSEVMSTAGQLCKERCLEDSENPVRIQLLWPKIVNAEIDRGQGLLTGYRFYLRKKNLENVNRTVSWNVYSDPNPVDSFLTQFLMTRNKEYSDLCNLPDLNERTLLENIKSRFHNSNIYTYVGSILIAVNPFKFFPIYNPKYVKMYQNKRLGDLPPHVFAIADAAFHTMLRSKKNQCIVISGESGSGKTESTNLLLHHLTALSHKGLHGSGVEQTILGAGPVLEAFGNAKTVHNNNSSRFGKFIQVNYKENGMVHGAIVEKYLLEKSRIVSQAKNERNYHVFYYLLEGADDLERQKLHLGKPEDYHYLNQSDCFNVDEVDEANEFSRLKQSMEMVGFSQVTQKRIFGVLSAVLHLGNVKFRKKGDQHHDESVTIQNMETLTIISQVLKVKERTLVEALTQKKATAGDETVVMNHRMEDAVATRDAMAKCLYGALFDWIVLKVNQALLAKRHNSEHQGNAIGVLDIFGFEDFSKNSFEQFCINYANEHLQYYFNQHIFKFEQEEYKKEGIQWKNIEFIDNTGCLELFSKKTVGLFALLDEECNFPAATNDTLLYKFHDHHSRGPSVYYEAPQRKEMAFTVVHYAGRVKYNVKDFREKNSDQIRTDIVGNLKSSSLSFVRELMGVDPVAVLRWTIVKTLIKSMFAFIKAGKKYRQRGGPEPAVLMRRKQPSTDYLNIPDLGSGHFISGCHSRHSDWSPRSPLHDNPSYSPRTSRAADGDHDDDVFIVKSPRNSVKSPVDLHLSEDEVIVMRQAERVMQKNKSFKPKSRPQTMFSDIKTLKAIASRTMYSGGKVNTKQKPPSVGAQFQWSLSRLMGTLNKANPFFIRCIKSNAYKEACLFDDVLVLRQLRYTGMLATVRIRQSGYNYRLTFEEFVMMYKILLPKGLVSGEGDVCDFLKTMNMDQDNYQIGKTKVFLREGEKLCLDNALHCAIMERVIFIQRLVKTKCERKNFVHLRQQVVVIQKYIRRFLSQRKVSQMRECALTIQRWYRGNRQKRRYCLTRHSAIRIQAHMKGHLCRKRYQQKKIDFYKHKEEQEALRRQAEEEEEQEASRRQAAEEAARHLDKQPEDLHSSLSDEGVLMKDNNSADELDLPRLQRMDSEESSGILDDSESDTLSEAKGSHSSVVSPPPTPTSTGPAIHVEGLTPNKDEYLSQARQSSRVQGLSRVFQNQDGRSVDDEMDGGSPGHIFIRRGSARKRGTPKMSPAPLAKQESFSDLESPPEKVSPLTPDRIQLVDDALRKPKVPEHLQLAGADDVRSKSPLKVLKGLVAAPVALRETKSFPVGDEGSSTLRRKLSVSTSTLIRRTKSSIKMLRDIKSGKEKKKKDSYTEDTDDEQENEHPMGRLGGVVVLPRHPVPKSPLTEKPPVVFSGDEHKSEDDKQIKKKRASRKNKEGEKEWIVAKMSQWQYPEDWVITDIIELQLLDEFIGRKIKDWLKDTGSKLSQFDRVFTKCLKSFHQELKSTLSIAMRGGNTCNTKYRELFANFGVTMEATCREEKVDSEFPVTMCLNSFRGFLDEFRNSVNAKKKDHKLKKKQNRPKQSRGKTKKDVIEHQGHKFSPSQFGIPTFCELCSTIMWIMEKGYVCQVCKYTCHRKCIQRSSTPCKGAHDNNPKNPGTKVFGIPLQSLVGKEEIIPVFVENLIRQIETTGLYTVGIYRKPGTTHGIRSLKGQLDLGKIGHLNLEDQPIHVLTSTLKSFFRELPEPLLTFELYDEFIQAAEIQDEKEAIQGLYALTGRLPKVNHDVFERLIFHLARVANHEKSNKMSVNALAIIFAPCLLRTNQELQAQESLVQVSRQQVCIDKILQEQLRKMETTLSDIKLLETAEETAQQRLSVVRASMKNNKSPLPKGTTPPASVTEEMDDSEESQMLAEQERVISSHIKSLRNEKDGLTSALPVLDYRHSSDDEMLSTEDMESTYDTADDMDFEVESGSSFDMPASPPKDVTHLTKERANNCQPPSRLNPIATNDDQNNSNPTTHTDHPTNHRDHPVTLRDNTTSHRGHQPQPDHVTTDHDGPVTLRPHVTTDHDAPVTLRPHVTTDHDAPVTLRPHPPSRHDTPPDCDIAEFDDNSSDTRDCEEDFIYRRKRTFKYLSNANFSTSSTSIDSAKETDSETDSKADTKTDSKMDENIGTRTDPKTDTKLDVKVQFRLDTSETVKTADNKHAEFEKEQKSIGIGNMPAEQHGTKRKNVDNKVHLKVGTDRARHPLIKSASAEELQSGPSGFGLSVQLVGSSNTDSPRKPRKLQRAAHVTHSPHYAGAVGETLGETMKTITLPLIPSIVTEGRGQRRGLPAGKSGSLKSRSPLRSQPINVEQKPGGKVNKGQHQAEARLDTPLSRQSSDTSVRSQNTTPGSSPRSLGSDSALLATSPPQSGLVLVPPAAGRTASHDNVGLPVTELEHDSEDEIMV